MVDPYVDGMLKKSIYADRFSVRGRLVGILDGELDNRNLHLISVPSRALRKGEIHELIHTDEESARPGCQVNSIHYVAFFEVIDPGIVLAGDQVFLNENFAGHLRGFDETHMPNHMNIVFFSEKCGTGVSMGLALGDEICFKKGVSNT